VNGQAEAQRFAEAIRDCQRPNTLDGVSAVDWKPSWVIGPLIAKAIIPVFR